MPRKGIVLLIAGLVAASGGAAPLGIRFDPEKMMLASEVKRGMEGYCLTVFQGTEPTKFRVKIMGVMPHLILGKPYIIFKAIDGPLIERDAPVMGGMSGSPVFVNGKLIGAVAYTRHFEKEPYGGITSIDAMIEGVTGRPVRTSFVPQPATIGGRTYTRVAFAPAEAAPEDTLVLRPLASRIYFTAGSERGTLWHRRLMGLFGFDAVPGAGSHPPVPVDIKPGSGMGVALATGDFLSYTFGTVTWREGDAIIGFGHSFSSKGDMSLPLTTVYIHDFVPNYRRTDKDGVIMEPVGTLSRDCPWAVGGVVGVKARTVPAVYRIVDETNDKVRTFHVNLAYDREVTPGVCLGTLSSSIDALYFGWAKPGVVEVRYRVRGAKGATIQRSDVYYHGGDPVPAAVSELAEVMRLLTDNRFEPQEVADVAVEARLRTKEEVARIERVYTDEEAAVAGKKLTVHVMLKPVGEAPVTKTVTFDLPWELPKAGVRLGVAGGEAADALRKELGGFTPEFHSLERVIKYMEALERNDELLVMVAYPRQGLAVEDTPLPGLPPTRQARLRAAHRTGVRPIKDYQIKAVKVPWVVQGRYVTSLPIVTRRGERGKPAPPKPGRTSLEAYVAKLRPAVDSVVMGTVPAIDWAHGVEGLRLVRGEAVGAPAGADWHPVQAPAKPAQPKKPGAPAKKPGAEKKAPAGEQGQVQAKTATWVLSSYGELAKGRLMGLAVDGRGWVVPGVRFDEPVEVPDPLVWDLAVSGGTCYVAAGLEATLYAVRGGKVSKFFHAPAGLFIPCAEALPDGGVACAVVPGARVYVLDGSGRERANVEFAEKYVWDLMWDGKQLVVATGRPGRLYRVGLDGSKKLMAVVPEEHVTALARRGRAVLAGTADRAGVYSVEDGRVVQLVGWDGGEVVGVAVLRDGRVVVGMAPKARVTCLYPDGRVEVWYQDDKTTLQTLVGAGDAAIVGLGPPAAVVRVRGREDRQLIARERSREMFSAFDVGAEGRLWAGVCLPGAVMAQQLKPAKLEYVSPARDAGRPARWARVLVDPIVGECKFSVATRTGSSPYYDSGLWSAWSGATAKGNWLQVNSPPGRYFQVRLTLPGSMGQVLKSVVVQYQPQNQPPRLKVASPQPGAAVHGKAEVKWEVSDPDKDTVEVSILLQRHGETRWQAVAGRLTGKSYKWDTTKVKDGTYRMRVVASDRPSRPVDAETATARISPLMVDNTAPTVELAAKPRRAKNGETVAEVIVHDALSGVAGVTWQYPGGKLWYTAAPEDGVYGDPYETCRVVLPADIAAGTKVTVRARDVAGNHADLVVTVPGTPKKGSK